MKLYTEINIEPLEQKIDFESKIFALGSCFAQRMSDNLQRAKFTCTSNPSGVLYNPLSILNSLERFDEERKIEVQELKEGAGGFFHFDFHSSLNDSKREACAQKINEAISCGAQVLRDADWVIITLGTAWVYAFVKQDEIRRGEQDEFEDLKRGVVANCHKRPAREFSRVRLSVQDASIALLRMLEGPLAGKKVIFTLSPIRHMADGLVENSLSKSTLRLAIEQVVSKSPRAFYFPAFELMMDELRDYRFYESDMLHPSSVAVSYIWDRFCTFAFSPSTLERMQQIEKILKSSEHRPLNPASEAHKAFCRSQLKAIEQLKGVDFSKEREYFVGQLKINL